MVGVKELVAYIDEWRWLHGGMTERELADTSDIAKGTFSGWRHAQAEPRPETIRKLAKAMEVAEEDLWALLGHAGQASQDGPSPVERQWLKMLRETRPDLRRGVLAMLREFHRQSQGQAQSRRATGGQSSHQVDR